MLSLDLRPVPIAKLARYSCSERKQIPLSDPRAATGGSGLTGGIDE